MPTPKKQLIAQIFEQKCNTLAFDCLACKSFYGWCHFYSDKHWRYLNSKMMILVQHVGRVWIPCRVLLGLAAFEVAGLSLKRFKLSTQQVPSFLSCCDRWSVAQHCCVRINRVPNNIAGLTHVPTHGIHESFVIHVKSIMLAEIPWSALYNA